ncbi:MAG TPA: biotin carboxylase N-terminal domain-containing protein [Dehalococcoidia bacterium]|nr:biotin carboxylase N-terminal domain-containing protein [Dehalococcoidia bacterium]
MFSKVLVANRGEIAVRIQQTLQILGVATVAVYSDPDSTAPHVAMASEAHSLGGQTAEETYLDIEKLIGIARRSGAEAIHPGYGFLSENPRFARACQQAGLVFIGPTPENLEALGDKVQSKEIARRAGVIALPSTPTCSRIDDTVEEFVKEWGFPVLVKAAAGGGGRGMRLAGDAGQLPFSLESASREAAAAFGDGRVFLEKYLPSSHHVEIQVLADGHGNTVHLLERECSVQRRHQKIIEETPSPALTPKLRELLGQAALNIARAAGYLNAGTVEFLLDPMAQRFYFLEMNPRLQVEHPITEAILGVDLVGWQVRIAAGETLTLHQDDLWANGHAVECRIYAEDPYQNFAPSTGTLALWRPPSGHGLRLDSGVAQGQRVPAFYDPMLAKLIAWGPDRPTSLRRMDLALAQFPVLGLITNIPYLREVIRHPRFQEGKYDTALLESEVGLNKPAVAAESEELARALAAWASGSYSGDGQLSRSGLPAQNPSPWHNIGGLRLP